jgi:hypothetical protein
VEEIEEQLESAGLQTCAAAGAWCSARSEVGRVAYITVYSRDALNISRFGTRWEGQGQFKYFGTQATHFWWVVRFFMDTI